MFYHLFEVEYISCEGNFRTANIVVESDDEVSVDTAQSVYYSNSDCFGDSPSQMVGGHLILVFESSDEMSDYCNRSNIFAETYSI